LGVYYYCLVPKQCRLVYCTWYLILTLTLVFLIFFIPTFWEAVSYCEIQARINWVAKTDPSVFIFIFWQTHSDIRRSDIRFLNVINKLEKRYWKEILKVVVFSFYFHFSTLLLPIFLLIFFNCLSKVFAWNSVNS